MEITKFKAEAKRLISRDEIDTAIKMLDGNLNPNSFLFDELIAQQSKFSELGKDIKKGIISLEHREIGMNKIRTGLIELINNIENKDMNFLQDIGSQESILSEIPKEYNGIIDAYVKENKRLQANLDDLKKEIEILKTSDHRVKLKNTIELYISIFKNFYGINTPMKSMLEALDENISNIDPGFALDQIGNINENIGALSFISSKLEILRVFFIPLNPLKKDTIINKDKHMYDAVKSYCTFNMVLDKRSIEKIITEIDVLLSKIEDIERP